MVAASTIQIVNVDLVEWGIQPNRISAKPGDILFRTINRGLRPHALAITDNRGFGAVLGKTLAPGEEAYLRSTLGGGEMTLYDPIEDYRRKGMEATILIGQ